MFAYNPNQNKEGDASHELGTKGSSMISMITIDINDNYFIR